MKIRDSYGMNNDVKSKMNNKLDFDKGKNAVC